MDTIFFYFCILVGYLLYDVSSELSCLLRVIITIVVFSLVVSFATSQRMLTMYDSDYLRALMKITISTIVDPIWIPLENCPAFAVLPMMMSTPSSR
jgi:hypothetical protein